MKKLIFITMALAFTTAAISAQGVNASYSTGQQPTNPDIEARAKDATDKLNAVVNLSQDQYNRVLQVNRSYFYGVQNTGGGRKTVRQGSGRDDQLKSILTSDQWQQYQTARQNGQIQ
jgi:hypothetical protein